MSRQVWTMNALRPVGPTFGALLSPSGSLLRGAIVRKAATRSLTRAVDSEARPNTHLSYKVSSVSQMSQTPYAMQPVS